VVGSGRRKRIWEKGVSVERGKCKERKERGYFSAERGYFPAERGKVQRGVSAKRG
jgi:hypothetical protein